MQLAQTWSQLAVTSSLQRQEPRAEGPEGEWGGLSWLGLGSGLERWFRACLSVFCMEFPGQMNYLKIGFLRLVKGISVRAFSVPPFVYSLNQVLL